MQTLSQWETENDATAYTAIGGAKYIHDCNLADRKGLWRLSDYCVSSIAAGVIWLVRRNNQ